jgi:DNA-binding response OmpR family regulator
MILTARTCESDHVAGLDAGADDYVDKPFGVLELKARMRAQLRRATLLRDGLSDFDKRALVVRGALTLDPASHEARLSEQTLELTAREFDLLLHFMRYPGQVFSRGELLDKVWGSGFEGYDHTVNSHINRLRAKIECNPAEPRWIETVRGVGYRFNSHTTI